MKGAAKEQLGYGIYCVDARYIREGLACCYLLVEGTQVAIIETGTAHTVAAIEAVLGGLGLSFDAVRYVVPTHVHLDHAGGAGLLMRRCENATLVVHPRGARHMINPARLIEGVIAVYGEETYEELYGELIAVPEQRVLAAEDGARIQLGSRSLEVRHTPGHAEHHFCVWDAVSKGWFTGDTFGLSYYFDSLGGDRFVMPTTTPVQFNPDRLLDSLELLMSYEPQRMYLTHYGVLEHPASYVQTLKEQICEWGAMARGMEKNEERESLIAQRLAGMLGERIAGQWPSADVAAIVDELNMDIELNAQGIEVWLKNSEQKES
jgi:glyoxylase-like metal-dependent hydrolase (beta-lactamase superfamily II)